MSIEMKRSSWIALIIVSYFILGLTHTWAYRCGQRNEIKKRAIIRTVDINAFDKEIRKLGYKIIPIPIREEDIYKDVRTRYDWVERRGWVEKK